MTLPWTPPSQPRPLHPFRVSPKDFLPPTRCLGFTIDLVTTKMVRFLCYSVNGFDERREDSGSGLQTPSSGPGRGKDSPTPHTKRLGPGVHDSGTLVRRQRWKAYPHTRDRTLAYRLSSGLPQILDPNRPSTTGQDRRRTRRTVTSKELVSRVDGCHRPRNGETVTPLDEELVEATGRKEGTLPPGQEGNRHTGRQSLKSF